jgi:hypothetical protein
MRSVWKATLELIDGIQVVVMPAGAKVLHVDKQRLKDPEGQLLDIIGGKAPPRPKLTMWFECDPGEEERERQFVVHRTGHWIRHDGEYVGTVIIEPFVWHVYEVEL